MYATEIMIIYYITTLCCYINSHTEAQCNVRSLSAEIESVSAYYRLDQLEQTVEGLFVHAYI
jgi:hypothetical protein